MVRRYMNPWDQLYREMDRLLTGMLRSWPDGPWFTVTRAYPALNLWEEEEALKLEAELPGVKKDQIDISVTGDELSLKVEQPEVEQKEVTYHRRERPVGTFTRVVRLPVAVEVDRVEADLHDGVLTVTLPKAAAARPRKITVATT